MASRVDDVPAWVPVVVWSLAIVLAVAGVTLALVLGSAWPLLTFAGLAVPLAAPRHRRPSRA